MKSTTLLMATNIVSIICGLVILGAIFIWAPVCPGMLELANGNMTPMRCTYTAKVMALLAIILILVCIAAMATKKPATVAVLLISIAIALLVLESPVTIGICKSTEMACWATAPWTVGGGVVSAVSALVGFALDPSRKHVKA